MTDSEQRVIGRLEAEMAALQQQMARQEAQNVQIMTELRSITETLASAKGGWKTLISVGMISSAIGVTAGKLLPLFANLPK